MKALRSMACISARRTRTSFSGGFLLLIARMPLPAVSPISTVKRLSAWNCFRLCGAEARHAVDVAGQQRRHLRRRVVDEAEA